MTLGEQIAVLLVLAIPIACVSWTITHEEIFREPRDFCLERSKACMQWYKRKFYYVLTCEYCLSHYVTVFFLVVCGFKLVYDDWRGYLIGFFSLVWVANIYMSFYNRVRLNIKTERLDAKIKEVIAGENEEKPG